MAADLMGPGALTVPQYQVSNLDGVAPPGWEHSIKRMKRDKGISNPFALAWYMKKRGAKPAKPEGSADAEFDASLRMALQESHGGAQLPALCLMAARGDAAGVQLCMDDSHGPWVMERR